MDFLPDIVVLQVFSYLQPDDLLRARQVCWQWKNLAENESLWSGVNMCFLPDKLDDEETDDYSSVYRCLRMGHPIQRIHLANLAIHYATSRNRHLANITATAQIKDKPFNNIRSVYLNAAETNEEFQEEFSNFLRMLAQELEEIDIKLRTAQVIIIDRLFPNLRKISVDELCRFGNLSGIEEPWPKLEEVEFTRFGCCLEQRFQDLCLPLTAQLRKITIMCAINKEEDMSILSSLAFDLQKILIQRFPKVEEIEIRAGVMREENPILLQGMLSSDVHIPRDCDRCEVYNSLDVLKRLANLSIKFMFPCLCRSWDLWCHLRYLKKSAMKQQSVLLIVELGSGSYYANDGNEAVHLIEYMNKVDQVIIKHIQGLDVIRVQGRSRLPDGQRNTLVNRFPKLNFEFTETYAHLRHDHFQNYGCISPYSRG